MKLKRFVAWFRSHRHAMAWGLGVSALLVSAILYVVGNTISDAVVHRNNLLNVEVLDLELEIYEATLSGQYVDARDAARPITGVMVENSPDARPQAGLSNAEVVFEAIAEGGITRFVAFYQVETAKKIGPVRSVRPHYNDWILSFDASIAHAGGSAQGLAEIRSFGIKDLDQFANASYYYRDSARFAPHNLYTSSALLDDLQDIKGFNKSVFEPWLYTDGEKADIITADTISVEVSSASYNLRYDYEPSTNKYLRRVGGSRHIDANTNKQIALDNVVIMEVSYTTDRSGYYHYDLVGEGKAHFFSNGERNVGEWKRSSRRGSFSFWLKDKEFELNRGHTWVTAIKPGNSVKVEVE